MTLAGPALLPSPHTRPLASLDPLWQLHLLIPHVGPIQEGTGVCPLAAHTSAANTPDLTSSCGHAHLQRGLDTRSGPRVLVLQVVGRWTGLDGCGFLSGAATHAQPPTPSCESPGLAVACAVASCPGRACELHVSWVAEALAPWPGGCVAWAQPSGKLWHTLRLTPLPTSQECSLFYTRRFCLPCVREHLSAFPQEIGQDVEKRKAPSKKPSSQHTHGT